MLKSVAYAWQQQSLTDDAKELFDLSRELYDRFAVLGENASKLGVSLARTVAAYNKFASSLESRVLVTARKLQKLDPPHKQKRRNQKLLIFQRYLNSCFKNKKIF